MVVNTFSKLLMTANWAGFLRALNFSTVSVKKTKTWLPNYSLVHIYTSSMHLIHLRARQTQITSIQFGRNAYLQFPLIRYNHQCTTNTATLHCHAGPTLEQPLQLGAVHIDVLHELYVVDIHCVLRAHRQLL